MEVVASTKNYVVVNEATDKQPKYVLYDAKDRKKVLGSFKDLDAAVSDAVKRENT